MPYRLRVQGPGARGPMGGGDFHIIANPTDVIEKEGLLIVNALGRTFPDGHPRAGRTYPDYQTTYARGAWTSITITEIQEEP